MINDRIANIRKALRDAEDWATVGMERQALRHLDAARREIQLAIEETTDRVEVSA